MIAFASIILSLVVGLQPVELLVGPGVAAVELRLDGETVARLAGPPWTTECDFGSELVPHRLEAVALDAAGDELERAVQWINMPRRAAEVAIVLEGGSDGVGVFARLSWQHLFDQQPVTVSVTLDGKPVELADPGRIRLPDFDPRSLHLLRVEMEFSDNVASVAEVTFGGSYSDRVSTELTAVPVTLERAGKVPPPEAMAGRLTLRGGPLTVLAVEEGPAEIVIVPERSTRPAIDELAEAILETGRRMPTNPALRNLFADAVQRLRLVAPLRSDQRLRFVDTHPEELLRPQGFRVRVFPRSEAYGADDGGLLWLLHRVRPLTAATGGQRLADAVAAAALAAAGQNRRRAIVLIAAEGAEDDSQFDAAEIRRYLDRLRVPLVVWTPRSGAGPLGPWGEATSISNVGRLERAFRDLTRLLQRQRIVWVDGAWLPQEIRVSAADS